MRQVQSLGLKQQLTITPQLLQSIRLMTMTAPELEQSLQDAVESNVMLEVASRDDATEETVNRISAAPSARQRLVMDYDDSQEAPALSPRMQIVDQLPGAFTDALEFDVALALVDEVEDCGYLTTDLSLLAEAWSVSEALLLSVLHRIQRLEPVGFGARNLRECLSTQLAVLPLSTPGRRLAISIVRHHLECLASADSAELVRRLEAEAAHVKAAVRLVRSLDPKPGAATDAAGTIIPDVIVDVDQQGQCHVRLNEASLPGVKINTAYESALRQCGAQGSMLRDQLQEAKLLIRGIEMRQSTLLKAASAIFARQSAFAEKGETGVAPMTLKEIATEVDMHESSISRVVRGKYAQTPHGVYELRYFFSAQVGGARRSDVSGNAVRAMVRDMIQHEMPEKPLCDGDISAMLLRRGIKLGRRTITKYRLAMNIPCAEERRQDAQRAG